MGAGCNWHPVSGGQGHRPTFHSAQNGPRNKLPPEMPVARRSETHTTQTGAGVGGGRGEPPTDLVGGKEVGVALPPQVLGEVQLGRRRPPRALCCAPGAVVKVASTSLQPWTGGTTEDLGVQAPREERVQAASRQRT